MLSYLLAVAFIPAVVFGHHHILPCPGGLPTPTAVRVQGCDSFPCYINSGDLVSYEVDFVQPHTTDALTLALNATVFGVEREVTLPPGASNACNSLIGASCPVSEGQSVTQGTTIPVFTEYHGGIPAQLRFQISHTMHGHEHICVCTLVNFIIN
ncbi:Mite group 2 allergen-like Ixo r 2 [Pseudolycoriella hygida]|uniref:Mite group 2 allergen-like Ixo r 2 n=1 Tax=Pseudolycoriella hygida TaxID=35572 RepID=A0A9Q0RWR5_9DIPT|nr:Mite group 2 allergen-like Ixo r 2 [Pseudolycoriella hygida]